MWGDESEAVAPIIWLYQIVDAQKEQVFIPELLITLRSYGNESIACIKTDEMWAYWMSQIPIFWYPDTKVPWSKVDPTFVWVGLSWHICIFLSNSFYSLAWRYPK